jgi:hypothetical protein
MKDNKRRSSKALMILILVMYINESALVALNWYSGWLGYVKYSSSNDQSLAVFVETEETSLPVLYIIAVTNLFGTVRLGIADSIMVMYFRVCIFSISNELFRSGAVGSSVTVAGEQQLFHLS